MVLKADSILFFLGAGASCEAGIPTSTMMINNVENLLDENMDWHKYKELYYCIKSSVMHRFGIVGDYDRNLVNIETLVNTMDELIKSINHPIYPFVGSWMPRLTELTNNNFKIIEGLRKKLYLNYISG
jgi:galactitol-specific phosphotransferase system IIB component